MTALDAYRTAVVLGEHGLVSDEATHADLDAAADAAGVPRPADPDDRHTVRVALDALRTGR
ncbi:hypothetical protein ABZ330_21680 [Streptomyces sp. NPDC006172]|uniref:hypothetical protein n=1 Tax=Streptomyces sp. NPDC006172 TaxID=3154470 RepID=UPI0033C29473